MKRLITMLAMVLLLSPIVLAQLSPPPTIAVQLKGSNIGNVAILLEDTSRVSQSHTLVTAENGEIVVNIDQYFPTWQWGDTIRATILECSSDAKCVQTQTVRSEGLVEGVWFVFDFSGTVVTVTETVTETVTNTEYVKCNVDKTLVYSEVYGPDNCNVKITAPAKPEPTLTDYDWVTFITGGGLSALMLYFVNKYVPHKGKIKVERRVDRYGKPYTVIMKWSPYTRKDGTTGYKWILVQTVR